MLHVGLPNRKRIGNESEPETHTRASTGNEWTRTDALSNAQSIAVRHGAKMFHSLKFFVVRQSAPVRALVVPVCCESDCIVRIRLQKFFPAARAGCVKMPIRRADSHDLAPAAAFRSRYQPHNAAGFQFPNPRAIAWPPRSAILGAAGLVEENWRRRGLSQSSLTFTHTV